MSETHRAAADIAALSEARVRRNGFGRGLAGLAALWIWLTAGMALAQGQVWVQIEAQPSLDEAVERAEAWAALFPDVAGFRLSSGWHAIVLGPAARDDARARLRALRDERMIPADSFIAEGGNFRERFWPGTDAAPDPDPAPPPTAAADPPAVIAPPETPAESLDEARAAEAALTEDQRKEIQRALDWFGFYDAAIDGAFGRGTRAAITAWQAANGARETGVLTRADGRRLTESYRAAEAAIGLQTVTEAEAGIEIDLPLAMVAFDRYEPPFVDFAPINGSGVRVLLISQPGDAATLRGLHDLIRTLDILPPGGAGEIDERSFTITGRNAEVETHVQAELSGGLVKGFALVWPAASPAARDRVLAAMRTSFRPLGGRALDPGLAPMPGPQRQGLLSGLEVERPALSRSGFFIDAKGLVLTTPDVLQSCARITIEGAEEMDLAFSDPAAGLAVLAPRRPLSPPAFAGFRQAEERVGAEVAVAGYSYEDALPSPALTFGRIEALSGLEGEPGLRRLDIATLPGDAGGPVVDGTGAVIGMLLPADSDAARLLPEGVGFAASAAAIAERMGSAGIALARSAAVGALPPDDLARRARGMTVLVSCWP